MRRFSKPALRAIEDGRILWIRAGIQPRRFRGVWGVTTQGRAFVRPWNDEPTGWYRVFLDEPRGAIQVGGREIRVRARRVRGERLLDAIDLAYAAKYKTSASLEYVRGFARPSRRARTMELVPR
jgi:hypothetical protein